MLLALADSPTSIIAHLRRPAQKFLDLLLTVESPLKPPSSRHLPRRAG